MCNGVVVKACALVEEIAATVPLGDAKRASLCRMLTIALDESFSDGVVEGHSLTNELHVTLDRIEN
jgi:hypothetical protein